MIHTNTATKREKKSIRSAVKVYCVVATTRKYGKCLKTIASHKTSHRKSLKKKKERGIDQILTREKAFHK